MALVGIAGALAFGCGDTGVNSGHPGATRFAVATTVFDDTNAATYVALLNSLEPQEIDLSSAREFTGWSSVASHESVLFVGHGERPEVTRYQVNDDGALEESQGPSTVSFAAYGLESGSLSFNTFVDQTRAHMSLEETTRIVWDPSDMALIGSVESPEVLAERDGMTVTAANYQGRLVRGNEVLQPFFWHDADWYAFHQESQIGVYSRDGRLERLIDAPCPALQIATTDEDGNTYFSGMVDTIARQLREPSSTLERCVVRIDAGKHEIAEGWPRRFEELTGGRPAGVFHYLKDGVGVLTVYHVENADPSSESFLDDWYTDDWGLWLVDLSEWRATPIESWGLGSSNVFFSRADERLFVHRVEGDFSSTAIFEIDVDGTITPQLTVPGYAAYPILVLR